MPFRYKIAGSGNWSDNASWDASSSGGSGGDSYPQIFNGDNVILDSGSGDLTINGNYDCITFDATGYTGTLTGTDSLTVQDKFTWSASGSMMSWSGLLRLLSSGIPDGSHQVDLGGVQFISFELNATTSSNGVQFVGGTAFYGDITVTQGTLIAGSSVTCARLLANSGTVSLMLISGITLTGTGTVWDAPLANASLTMGTILVSDSSGSGKTFAGGDQGYNTVDFASGNGPITITGNNTFGTLSCGAPLILTGTTQTVTTLNIFGCPSITGGTLSVASGTVTAPSGCTITNNTATGGATFDGSNAIDGGGNSGWTFAPTSFRRSWRHITPWMGT